MERSKQNKHIVCNKDSDVDNGVDNGDDDSVDHSVDDGGVNSGVDCADKYLVHLSQAADCCLMERSMQNKHVACNKDNDADNGVDN
eukprot:12505094-Ditylum_brightwellii.AAC.1